MRRRLVVVWGRSSRAGGDGEAVVERILIHVWGRLGSRVAQIWELE